MFKQSKPVGEAKGQSPGRRFLLIFLMIVAGYYCLTLVPWVDRHVLYPLLEGSAKASSLLLNVLGQTTTSNGIVIQGTSFAVAVRRGCDPLEPIALLSAAVIAFPAALRYKVAGLIAGAALLFALNLVRIGSLYWLGCHKSAWFETVHLELWPACFILVSIGLWVLWLIWIRKTQPLDA